MSEFEYSPEQFPPLETLDPDVRFDDPEHFSLDYFPDDIPVGKELSIPPFVPPEAATVEQNLQLWRQYKSGDLHAYNELITGNLRLVEVALRKPSMHFHGQHLKDDDVRQNGAIALGEIIQLWDPSRLAFSTFLVHRLCLELRRAYFSTDRLVRLPVPREDQIAHIAGVLGEEPARDKKKLATIVGLKDKVLAFGGKGKNDIRPADFSHQYSAEEYVDYLFAISEGELDPVPYDEPDGDKQVAASSYYTDQIRSHQPEEQTIFNEDVVFARQLLEQLGKLENGRLRAIVEFYYGFHQDGKRLSYEEIGDHFGMSRQRVNQLMPRAMECLRELASGLRLEETVAYKRELHNQRVPRPRKIKLVTGISKVAIGSEPFEDVAAAI